MLPVDQGRHQQNNVKFKKSPILGLYPGLCAVVGLTGRGEREEKLDQQWSELPVVLANGFAIWKVNKGRTCPKSKEKGADIVCHIIALPELLLQQGKQWGGERRDTGVGKVAIGGVGVEFQMTLQKLDVLYIENSIHGQL